MLDGGIDVWALGVVLEIGIVDGKGKANLVEEVGVVEVVGELVDLEF